jgi:hypothetical protein
MDLKLWENVRQEDRFYDEHVPRFDYEPLKTFFQIVKSPEQINEGVLSLISLQPEDIAFKWTGYFLTEQTLHSLQYKEGIYIHDQVFCGKILHDCEPNLKLNMEDLTAIVIKPIKVFDKLTLDYNDTEDFLYNAFNCTCGSKNCKGWIAGKKAVEENEKKLDKK